MYDGGYMTKARLDFYTVCNYVIFMGMKRMFKHREGVHLM